MKAFRNFLYNFHKLFDDIFWQEDGVLTAILLSPLTIWGSFYFGTSNFHFATICAISSAAIVSVFFLIYTFGALFGKQDEDTLQAEKRKLEEERAKTATLFEEVGLKQELESFLTKAGALFTGNLSEELRIMSNEKDDFKKRKISRFLSRYLPLVNDVLSYKRLTRKHKDALKIFEEAVDSFYQGMYIDEVDLSAETLKILAQRDGYVRGEVAIGREEI